jgi:hypothetical protein
MNHSQDQIEASNSTPFMRDEVRVVLFTFLLGIESHRSLLTYRYFFFLFLSGRSHCFHAFPERKSY